jgi:tetratricopeptide (TPR) repeat protein
MPGYASFVYSTLGIAYESLGDFSKAIEYHTQHLAITKEVGDRAGEGAAYANLGCAYQSQGDFSKAIKYHGQHGPACGT